MFLALSKDIPLADCFTNAYFLSVERTINKNYVWCVYKRDNTGWVLITVTERTYSLYNPRKKSTKEPIHGPPSFVTNLNDLHVSGMIMYQLCIMQTKTY